MDQAPAPRSRRLLAGVILVIVGPLLGAAVFVLGNVIGWIGTLAFLLAWGVLGHRLILAAGAGRWTACIGAVIAVVWTVVLPTLLIIAALPGPSFESS